MAVLRPAKAYSPQPAQKRGQSPSVDFPSRLRCMYDVSGQDTACRPYSRSSLITSQLFITRTTASMSKHDHSTHSNEHHESASHAANRKKRIHHDWRFWTAIVLMLVAMAAYVLSFDESLRPDGVDGPQVPMAAE